jgi:hypothetical protein
MESQAMMTPDNAEAIIVFLFYCLAVQATQQERRKRSSRQPLDLPGQMGAIMRAYIVIGALAVLAISAGIYAANTQIEQAAPGYGWADQEALYEADNGKSVPQPLNPDDDNGR